MITSLIVLVVLLFIVLICMDHRQKKIEQIAKENHIILQC